MTSPLGHDRCREYNASMLALPNPGLALGPRVRRRRGVRLKLAKKEEEKKTSQEQSKRDGLVAWPGWEWCRDGGALKTSDRGSERKSNETEIASERRRDWRRGEGQGVGVRVVKPAGDVICLFCDC